MCSNIWARPVLPMGSCAEPASTRVKKENTGASGRSQTSRVKPFGSFLTVMRFSNDATSCPATKATSSRIEAASLAAKYFIGPPSARANRRRLFDGQAGQMSLGRTCRAENLKVRAGKGDCQTEHQNRVGVMTQAPLQLRSFHCIRSCIREGHGKMLSAVGTALPGDCSGPHSTSNDERVERAADLAKVLTEPRLLNVHE